MTYEEEGFRAFLAGRPLSPEDLPWWERWLEEMQELTRQGKRISRVRVLSEPPTPYQRWELWGTPWHLEAGEDIRYISASAAAVLDIPLTHDWWLLDDERLLVMQFAPDGQIQKRTLTTDPEIINQHRVWRDLAVNHAAPAELFAAA